MKPIAPYAAVAMQLTAQSVEHCADRDDVRRQVLAQIAGLEAPLRAARAFIEQYGGQPLRLAVLPEYLFTSYPGRVGVREFAETVAFDMDGAEYAALGALAQRLDIFLAGNAYERDPLIPGLYFQASFVFDPSGSMILRYRRIFSMFAPGPHDVWDQYLAHYGIDGVFPVADTAIGRLAAIASEEILYPEIARVLALRGAEVLLHSSSEIGSPLATAKDVAKSARAWESMAYVISANTAGIAGGAMPLASADGGSRVVDPQGRVLAQSGPGETFTAFATIEIERLRALRRVPAMTNSLARQRPGLFAQAFATLPGHEANGLLGADGVEQPARADFLAAQQAVIDRLSNLGVI